MSPARGPDARGYDPAMGDHQRLDPEIAAHYGGVPEQQRLGPLSLERVRTWELLTRHLPPLPAVVLDRR